MFDKWAEYKEKFCGCKDASSHNSCRGLANCYLHANHPERKVLATPPADAADMGGQAGEEVDVRGLQWLDTGHYRKKPPQFGYNPHDWNPLMTVAQHCRILAQHRQQAGKLVEALEEIASGHGEQAAVAAKALADWEKTSCEK